MGFATVSRRPRGVIALLLLSLSICVGLTAVAPAFAGTVGNWAVQPKGNTTTGVPIIAQASGTPDGYPLVASSIKLTIDGVIIPRASYTATISSAKVYLDEQPLAGPQRRPAHLPRRGQRHREPPELLRVDRHGAPAAPSASWTSPTSGQTIYSGSPQIVMNLADNTPSTTFSVAGQVRSGSSAGTVVSTFGGSGLAAGTNTFTLPDELVFGTYTLTATITDAAGNARTLTGTTSHAPSPP